MQSERYLPIPLPGPLMQYLDSLTKEEGDRVLTTKLTHGTYAESGPRKYLGGWFGPKTIARCLVGAVVDLKGGWEESVGDEAWKFRTARHDMASGYFENLCHAYGLERTTASIRQHLLDLRVEQTVQPKAEPKVMA